MEAGGLINFEEQEQADDQHFEQWTPEEKRKAFAYEFNHLGNFDKIQDVLFRSRLYEKVVKVNYS